MKYKTEVTAGTTGFDRNGDVIDKPDARIGECRALAGSLFGGFTARIGFGGYTNQAGESVLEPCITFVCYYDGLIADGIGETFASTVRDILKRESVVLAVSEVNARFV